MPKSPRCNYQEELKKSKYPVELYLKGRETACSPWGRGGVFHLPELPSGVITRTSCYPEIARELACLRILAPAGGWLSAEALELLADCAERCGLDLVQFSTGGSMEMFLPVDKAAEAVRFLNEGGLDVGSTGDDLRAVTSCCGPPRCEQAVVDAPALATYLGQQFMEDQQYPSFVHKAKMAVAGCSCDCIRASMQKDIALIGISGKDGAGVQLVVGGKYGCRGPQGPMLGQMLFPFISLNGGFDQVYRIVNNLLEFWNDYGERKERLGDFLTRLGGEKVRQAAAGKDQEVAR